MDDTTLFARQSIFDVNNHMVACEILYRGPTLLSSAPDKQIQATRELLLNTCTSILNDNINLGLPMFINIDENFLLSEDFFPIPPQNIMFEILGNVPPSPQVLNKMRQLKSQGFEFALDDYLLEKSKIPFFKYLKIIKVDLIDVDFNLLKNTFSSLKQSGCLLLAEKVENQKVFEQCKKLGFDLFQGFYLEKPTLLKGKKIDANKQNALNLVSQLSRVDIEIDEVAELISQDPALVIKILALINCPLYQLVRDVKSVKDAVVILGLTVVKQWAMILTLVAESTQPAELFRIMLIRAKTLALYSEQPKGSGLVLDSSSCFLLGLLSGIDAIFEAKLEDILSHLKLQNQIKDALLGHNNDLGLLLKNSIGIERFDSEIFEQLSNQEICHFNRCYRASLQWADKIMNYLPT